MRLTVSRYDPVIAMDDVDFKALGFKCGLEIHQQLRTDRKLFCRCPPVYRNDPAHYTIIRHMRPTLSEMGTYDGTALMEFKTRKNVTYEFFRDTTCSYEIDDTPPFEMDEKALEISMVIAKAMNCQLVDEVHVSRKQYLDGSIPTGFQRTAIISLGGHVRWNDRRRIDIRQISLEEDACRERKDVGHDVVFRTDRLSIPLIEVVTEPNAKTPDEAGEMAEILGWVMRSTGLVRRGPGSTRQDVNVSVEGGTRIEIKGVPSLDLIPPITAGEAVRQHNLLLIKKELEDRSLKPESMDVDGFKDMTALDVTDMFEGSPSGIFSNWFGETVEKGSGNRIMAVKVRGFKGIFAHITHGDQTFLDELSGRIRVIACLDRLPNLHSSDNGPTDGLSEEAIKEISKRLGMDDSDAFVLVWGDGGDMKTACEEIYIRTREAMIGVPNETRQVLTPNTNTFERILPGPDRMYPDTDRPPIVVTDEIRRRVMEQVPRPYWEEEADMLEAGVPHNVAHRLVVSEWMDVYRESVSRGSDPKFTAVALMEKFRMLSRRGLDLGNIDAGEIVNLLEMIGNGTVSRRSLPDLVRIMAETGASASDAVRSAGLGMMDIPTAEERIRTVIGDNDELVEPMRHGTEGPLMGAVMSDLGTRFDGSKARDLVLKMI
ncbi:MAG: Glu-tRNA(Gln) amidotransferase subunit GatE [Thermoplasmatota archaeon]